MTGPEKKPSPLIVAIAWLVVSIPLAWGVYESLMKSLPLFRLAEAAPRPSRGRGTPSPADRAQALLRELAAARDVEADLMQEENDNFNRKERVQFYEIVETELEG